MTPDGEARFRLAAAQATADRLAARIGAGRRVTGSEVAGFRRELGRVPRGTGAIPSWRFTELEATLRDVLAASAVPVPSPRSAGDEKPPPRKRPRSQRREHSRVAAVRKRIERFERRCASGGSMLSCDVVNLDADLRVLRIERRMTKHDLQAVDDLARRVRKLAHLVEGHGTRQGRRRSSEGAGFWQYPKIGLTPLAAGEMLHGPRTSNKGRPARSAWWCGGGGLPALGKR